MQIASPKGVVACAYRESILSNEEVWLGMLEDRNLTSHDYDRNVAESVVDRISNRYAKELTRLCKYLAESLNRKE